MVKMRTFLEGGRAEVEGSGVRRPVAECHVARG